MIELRDVCLELGGQTIHRDLNIEFERGQHYLLTGPNGSGKSTLLALLAGLVKPSSGTVSINGQQPLNTAQCSRAMVLQDPASQIIFPDVDSEISFGAINAGFSREKTQRILKGWRETLGIDSQDLTKKQQPSDFTGLLSGGEQQLVVLASTMSGAPDLLLLDEPTSMLDDVRTAQFMDAISILRQDNASLTIVHATHDSRVAESGDVCMEIQGHNIVTRNISRSPLAEKYSWPDIKLRASISKRHFLAVTNVGFSYTNDSFLFRNLSFDLPSGDLVCIFGGNGSGKSSFLELLFGWANPSEGKLKFVDNVKIGIVFQRIEESFFERTVTRELAASLKLVDEQVKADMIKETLHEFKLTSFAERDPVRISGGERRLLAIASIAVTEPDVIVIDEPFSGMDKEHCLFLIRLFRQWCETGKAVIITASRADHAFVPNARVIKLHSEQCVEIPRSDLDKMGHSPICE